MPGTRRAGARLTMSDERGVAILPGLPHPAVADAALDRLPRAFVVKHAPARGRPAPAGLPPLAAVSAFAGL